MTKYFTILLILTACKFSSNIQDTDWRRYFVSEDSLKEGIVKKVVIQSNQGDFVYYDEVFLDNDKILLQRYNNDFELVREDVSTTNSERMSLSKTTYYFKNIGAVPVRIIQPTVAPYIKTEENLVSKLEYSPTDHITITITTKAKYLNNEKRNFLDKEIDCLKFSYEEEYKLTNSIDPSKNIEHHSTGYTLWGENAGLIYMRFKDKKGVSEYLVNEVLTISEFEKLKL